MFQFKSISLRIRIFLAMILLVLLASVLILGVTIYQYDEETKEYNIERFGRKEVAVKKRIELVLKREEFSPITTEKLSGIFEKRIFEISSVHNLDLSIYNLKGDLLKTSIIKPFNDTISYKVSKKVFNDMETLADNRAFYENTVGKIH